MSGFVTAMSPCITCGKVFSYNPHKVPSSSAITGKREPVCQGCMNLINAKRQGMGLDPFPILPGAYDPMPEAEL
jgi:hypothetical protein